MASLLSNRRPSAPWSRLKAPSSDYLESIGLPSKGDTRLLDHKTQRVYYAKIVERYMQFCATAGRRDDTLADAFAALALTNQSATEPESQLTPAILSAPTTIPASSARSAPGIPQISASSSSTPASAASSADLHTILLAMRKLREGLLASRRHDHFAQRAYVFIVRAALLTSSWEAYAPALRHLLHTFPSAVISSVASSGSSSSNNTSTTTPSTAASSSPPPSIPAPEHRELASYLVLDLACRIGDLGAAHRARHRWAVCDEHVVAVLNALVRGDWIAFWRVRARVDGYVRALLGWAEAAVRRHALKCLGSAYLGCEVGFVEQCAAMEWEALVREEGVGWEREGRRVTIRRVRRREIVMDGGG